MLFSLLIPVNLLQNDVDSLAVNLSESNVSDAMPPDVITLLNVIISGGTIGYILLFMLLVVAALIVFQFLTLKRAKKIFSKGVQNELEANVRFGDFDAAKETCRKEDILISRLILPAFEFEKYGKDSLEKAVENQGKIEFHKREKYITWLGIISGFAPMLGFLGTVIGMIQAFNAMKGVEGTVSAADLAGGISIAMVTTALGLTTGICAYLAYHFLNSSLNKVMHNTELETSKIIELMKSKIKPKTDESESLDK